MSLSQQRGDERTGAGGKEGGYSNGSTSTVTQTKALDEGITAENKMCMHILSVEGRERQREGGF